MMVRGLKNLSFGGSVDLVSAYILHINSYFLSDILFSFSYVYSYKQRVGEKLVLHFQFIHKLKKII